MSHLDGGKKEAPDDGGDRRLDLGGGDEAEDLGKRGEKFRKTEEEEKNAVPEEYKEALELVGSLAMNLSEGPITVEKLNEIDKVVGRVTDLAYSGPGFDIGKLYQRWGLTTPTTRDGVTFYFHRADGSFKIEATDRSPDRITDSQLSLIQSNLESSIWYYLQETEDSVDEINSHFEQYDDLGLSYYNSAVETDIVRRLGLQNGIVVNNERNGKTYQLRYDSKKHCLRVDERLELEGQPR